MIAYYSVLYKQDEDDEQEAGLWEVDEFFDKLEQRADEQDTLN